MKHYFRSYVDAEQANWTNLLSLTKFVYNNFTHASVEASSFYLMYEYNSEIHYEVENNFIKKEISSAKERIKRLHDIWNQLMQRLQRVSVEQIKYYNINYKLKKYVVGDLILLSIRNFKQKRSNKKLSHKFVESFKMKNKIEKQTYRFTLSNIYRIHNTFHVSFLKSYLHRADNAKAKIIM